MENIGQVVVYAASNHRDSDASQAYLWCLSRLNMAKFVQRSVIARRTPKIVRMVLTQFDKYDRLPSGMLVHTALKQFKVCKMLSKVLQTTFVKIRYVSNRKVQIVIEWNTAARYLNTMEQTHWESQMKDAYTEEQNARRNELLRTNDDYWQEYVEEMRERWADETQMNSMNARS